MASEQMSRPETYGDVFGPGVGQDLAHKPIVREDAAAMQSAENQVRGTNRSRSRVVAIYLRLDQFAKLAGSFRFLLACLRICSRPTG